MLEAMHRRLAVVLAWMAMGLAAAKLGVKTKFVAREEAVTHEG